jgi:DNA-binding CsgD family transcriptional regulator
MGQWCWFCEQLGIRRITYRALADGRGMCGGCLADIVWIPMAELCQVHEKAGIKEGRVVDPLATVTQAQNPQGEKPMIKTEEVKQLHADGMEPGAIAKKLGVSPSAVTYHLRKNGASRKSLSPERRAKVVADLKAKRDKLTEAIEVLEAL